jgi:single-strand DNA-binding protein
VNNRRRNATTGDWEDEPVFIDVEAFNRGDTGKLADRVEQTLRKGQQIFVEGHLKLDQWTSQDGQKRQKLSVVCDNFQYLEPRSDAGDGGARMNRGGYSEGRKPSYPAQPEDVGYESHIPEMDPPPSGGAGGDRIPF